MRKVHQWGPYLKGEAEEEYANCPGEKKLVGFANQNRQQEGGEAAHLVLGTASYPYRLRPDQELTGTLSRTAQRLD